MDQIPTQWLWRHRAIWIGFAAGALGFALLYGGWHLWRDHADLHQLINIEVQRQQAIQRHQMQQQQATPAPGRSGG